MIFIKGVIIVILVLRGEERGSRLELISIVILRALSLEGGLKGLEDSGFDSFLCFRHLDLPFNYFKGKQDVLKVASEDVQG
jgi:hypothetical protein